MRAALNRFVFLFCILLGTSCEKVLDAGTAAAGPTAVYEDLWRAIDQKYALFSVKTVDWDSMYMANISTINDNLSEADLFKKCVSLLEVLTDGHISLIANDRVYTYENFFRNYPINFNLDNIINNYLNRQYTKLGPIIYKVVNNIAYMYYGSFREDITDDALEIFFKEIANTKGLIIDVRSNSGGNLSNVEKIYSRFIKSRMLVKYELHKRGVGRTDFFNEEEHYISPSPTNYNKPIVLLTNRSCFSACNDFALYMTQLENVKLVGDQTGGGGAIPAEYILVNGWKLQYSSSLTLSPEHKSVENGILPDTNIMILPIQESRGLDPILEKAYEMLR